MSGKVFGIGLSKTGTTSLYAALQILEYRSGSFRHMKGLGLESWIEGDFSPDYLADFDAMTDLPIANFFRELDKRYAGSRFILTTRDIDTWLTSIRNQFSSNPRRGRFSRSTRLMAYGFSIFNEEAFRRVYLRHVEDVRNHFEGRPDQLLEVSFFDGDGWEKICPFLGRPVPAQPFPNVKPGFDLQRPR